MRFEAALGEAVRRRREELGWTQEELARQIRPILPGWTAPVVAHLEAGRRELTFPELVAVLKALRASLPALVGDQEVVVGWFQGSLGDLVAGVCGHRDLSEVLRSSPPPNQVLRIPTIRVHGTTFPPRIERPAAKGVQAMQRRVARRFPGATVDELERAQEASYGLAEQKAARKLGVDPLEVALAAFRTWGRSLTEERDARAAGDASPQARGHLTRRLLEELEPRLRGRRRRGKR